MASTIQLANTINWAKPFLNYRPLTLGASNEPAVSSANTILQTIVSPPFAWRWNRNTVTFDVTTMKQDFTVKVADFGYMEKAVVTLEGGAAPNTFELETQNILGQATEQARPHSIAAQMDDGSGNLTFRVMPYPDQNYKITVTYQKKANLFKNIVSTWSPIPDEYSYIFNWGFLALMMMYANDPRFQLINAKFVSSLLGVAEGLSETDKSTFLANWNSLTDQSMVSSLKKQQGIQSRGI